MSLLLRALPYVILLAVIAAVAWWLEDLGYQRGKSELAEYIAEQASATAATQRVVEKIVHDVEVRYVDRVRVVKERGETIVKEVPVYVTKTDDAACELRAGFVRLHDAAAKGDPPGPAVESDRAPAGVALAEAAGVIADNYKTCRLYKERAESLIEAYAGIKAQYDH